MKSQISINTSSVFQNAFSLLWLFFFFPAKIDHPALLFLLLSSLLRLIHVSNLSSCSWHMAVNAAAFPRLASARARGQAVRAACPLPLLKPLTTWLSARRPQPPGVGFQRLTRGVWTSLLLTLTKKRAKEGANSFDASEMSSRRVRSCSLYLCLLPSTLSQSLGMLLKHWPSQRRCCCSPSGPLSLPLLRHPLK